MRYALFSILFLMAACAPKPAGGPPQARFGQDVCARCGMIVSEPRFAAGYIDEKGESVIFDDVGEALAAVRQTPALKDRLYVNDMEEPGWLSAADAFFVHAPGLTTPMGSGIAVFRTRDRAASFAQARQASEPKNLATTLEQFK